jgi:hypothetical protein
MKFQINLNIAKNTQPILLIIPSYQYYVTS